MAEVAREVDRVNAVIHVPEVRAGRTGGSVGRSRRSRVRERVGRARGRRCVRA